MPFFGGGSLVKYFGVEVVRLIDKALEPIAKPADSAHPSQMRYVEKQQSDMSDGSGYDHDYGVS